MQHTDAGTAKRPVPPRRRCTPRTILILSAVLLATACGFSDDVKATMGLTSETESAGVDAQANMQSPRPAGRPGPMTVTPRQRGYLDALTTAGVRPSSELLALSIGSYVCQAKVAKQSDQAVWDLVLPRVRSELRTTHTGAEPNAPEIKAVTADYIRIATERLC